jgi:hypothetical protein
MRWPYDVGPIGSIRQLAKHLSAEFAIPPPRAPYADPYQKSHPALDLPVPRPGDLAKNQPAVFLLSSPRAGSTLLRVMLARHPALFCGPELHLLPFESMAQRHHLIQMLGYPWMEQGLVQTLAKLEQLTPEQAEQRVGQLTADDLPIQEVYRLLQNRAGDRLLVDKSPPYTFSPTCLLRAEAFFDRPKYLFLVRHPCATTESFVRMRFHWLIGDHFGVWDDNPWLFAEKVWAACNRNAIDFLRDLSPRRQYWLCYEDLVAHPDATMKEICDLLSVPFDPAVLSPYQGINPTWELGDPNLLNYRGLDPTLATAWKKRPPPQQLSPFTREVASELGYVLD